MVTFKRVLFLFTFSLILEGQNFLAVFQQIIPLLYKCNLLKVKKTAIILKLKWEPPFCVQNTKRKHGLSTVRAKESPWSTLESIKASFTPVNKSNHSVSDWFYFMSQNCKFGYKVNSYLKGILSLSSDPK